MIFVSEQTHEVKEIEAAMNNGATVKPWRVDANGVKWFTLQETPSKLRGVAPDYLPTEYSDEEASDDE